MAFYTNTSYEGESYDEDRLTKRIQDGAEKDEEDYNANRIQDGGEQVEDSNDITRWDIDNMFITYTSSRSKRVVPLKKNNLLFGAENVLQLPRKYSQLDQVVRMLTVPLKRLLKILK